VPIHAIATNTFTARFAGSSGILQDRRRVGWVAVGGRIWGEVGGTIENRQRRIRSGRALVHGGLDTCEIAATGRGIVCRTIDGAIVR
jgi:hypothetical protein